MKRAEVAVKRARDEFNALNGQHVEQLRKVSSQHRERVFTLYKERGIEYWTEWYECGRKTLYIFREDAEAGAQGSHTAYVCRWCTGFHTGTAPKAGYSLPDERAIRRKMVLYMKRDKL